MPFCHVAERLVTDEGEVIIRRLSAASGDAAHSASSRHAVSLAATWQSAFYCHFGGFSHGHPGAILNATRPGPGIAEPAGRRENMTIIPVPAHEPPQVRPPLRLTFRMLLAIDIQGYSRRTPRLQVAAQLDLLDAMDRAAEAAGLDRNSWSQQVAGDGVLSVLPADADIVTVVGVFAPALERMLAVLRETAGPERRVRVRLALHHGAMIIGWPAVLGPAGHAPVVVSRLLDARPVRRYLDDHEERNVALIVSDRIFRDVVGSGLCALPPASFVQVRAVIKGIPYEGYLHDPGCA
jgi:hypothetical protein